MRLIIPTLFLAGALLVVACNRGPVTILSSDVKQPTPTPETVQSLISLLSSENDELRKQAEKKLIDIGRQSATQRVDIINQLLRAAESQDDLKTGKCYVLREFNYWMSVTNIFAELQATEAIDILITTIACGNGYSGSLLVEPSMDALVKLGPITKSKLQQALRREKNQYVRIQLDHCLQSLYWKERSSQ
jgi:hypothetical protein